MSQFSKIVLYHQGSNDFKDCPVYSSVFSSLAQEKLYIWVLKDIAWRLWKQKR